MCLFYISGCVEEDLYICDLRVDKKARSFDKVSKKSQMVCTKPFAFDHFVSKVKIQRNVHVSLIFEIRDVFILDIVLINLVYLINVYFCLIQPHGPPSPDFKARQLTNNTTKSEKGRPKKVDDKAKKTALIVAETLKQVRIPDPLTRS